MFSKKNLTQRFAGKIDRKTKRAVLKEILSSKEFVSSHNNQKLLKFLVEMSIKNATPSEYDIAMDVFDKGPDFNPNEDAIVRVSIHNLRKKLEEYYLHEGKHVKTRIEIPKGSYEVVFKRIHTNTHRLLFNPNALVFFLLIVLTVLLIWSQMTVHQLKKTTVEASTLAHTPVWQDIFRSPLPRLLVLGDDFFFLRQEENKEIIVRKHNINSQTDLDRLVHNFPSKGIKGKTPYAFVPMASIKPLLFVLPLFKSGQTIHLKCSSALETKDLLENDLIFFGTFRNLYMLHQIIKNQVASYKVGLGKNSLTLNLGDSLATFALNGNPEKEHSDYCFVSKVQGPHHNTLLLFISFFETGIIGATQYMTDPKSLHTLETKFKTRFGTFPPYFKILFKTSGFSRTAFTTHIVYFDRINPEKTIW
ncbi:MAG: hypothetical protein GXO76_04755 [Calditrichaeota bacterium]|nr:hypothetical protein [Calditrichota bacterium]